jgi:two-component system chemotaxis response regulator CheY
MDNETQTAVLWSRSPVPWHKTFCKKRMRVLIADDQRSVGTSLAELVKHCNHDIVAVVGSGVEAIQAYGQHHPDVVLMDYWMPKLNGATACRNIVAKDPSARVILVSGWLPSNVMVGDSGALALLPKPVDLDKLAVTLDNVAQTLPFQEVISDH